MIRAIQCSAIKLPRPPDVSGIMTVVWINGLNSTTWLKVPAPHSSLACAERLAKRKLGDHDGMVKLKTGGGFQDSTRREAMPPPTQPHTRPPGGTARGRTAGMLPPPGG